MSEHEEPRPLRLGLGHGLVVMGLVRWAQRRQDSDRPEIVPGGAKVEAVLRRAGELTRENRFDDRAVHEITAAAAGSRRTLAQAGRASRFCGLHHELADQNAVFRLIEAARTGKPVAETTHEDRLRIEAVDALMRLPAAERWALLTEREPRLAQLEQQVRAGAFGDLRSGDHGPGVETGRTRVGPDGRERPLRSSRAHYSDIDARELMELGKNMLALNRRVSKLLGPDTRHDDLVLRTKRAQQVAAGHLLDINPLTQPPSP